MVSCQNYGPFFGHPKDWNCSIVGAQQGTITLRTPSMCSYALGCSSKQLSLHIKLGIATLKLRLRPLKAWSLRHSKLRISVA